MFDFLDANKSGELYTAEAVDGLRKLDDNNQIPFNLTWREVNIGVSYFLKIWKIFPKQPFLDIYFYFELRSTKKSKDSIQTKMVKWISRNSAEWWDPRKMKWTSFSLFLQTFSTNLPLAINRAFLSCLFESVFIYSSTSILDRKI